MSLKLPWSGLSSQAKRGLLAHALHWQAVQIGSLYVSVFLFRLGHGYALPAWHAFCNYSTIPVGYWMAAGLTRRFGAGTSLRLGLSVYAAFQLVILLLGEQAGAYAGSLGLLWGLGVGLYWQAWVLLMVDLSEDGADRDRLLGNNQAMYFLASFTGAPLAGWFLSRFEGTGGYPWVFGLGFILFVAAWVVSLPLKGRTQHSASAVGRLLKTRKPEGWGAGLFSAALMGLLSVGGMLLPLLISYDTGGGEGHSGVYTALVALAGFTASALVARHAHPRHRRGLLFWSALAVAACSLPLAVDRGYGLVLLYGLGMAVAMSVFNVPLFATQIAIVESSPRFRHRRADAMFLREVPLWLGRAVASGAILWGVKALQSQALSLLLVAMALVPLSNYLLMRRWIR